MEEKFFIWGPIKMGFKIYTWGPAERALEVFQLVVEKYDDERFRRLIAVVKEYRGREYSEELRGKLSACHAQAVGAENSAQTAGAVLAGKAAAALACEALLASRGINPHGQPSEWESVYWSALALAANPDQR